MEYGGRGAAPGWWALTGTPGTGKSRVARDLPPDLVGVDLVTLARAFGGRALQGGSVEVDLARIARFLRTHRPRRPIVVAGYLAHRLPVEGIVVLRCHPRELERRLRDRGEPPARLAANVTSEALDTIAREARRAGPPVVELDTTRRLPKTTAARVRDAAEGRRTRSDAVDWLSDPAVPDRLRALGG